MKAVANIIQERRLLEEVCRIFGSHCFPPTFTCAVPRSITHSSSTCVMRSRMMRTASLCWISCLEGICAVRPYLPPPVPFTHTPRSPPRAQGSHTRRGRAFLGRGALLWPCIPSQAENRPQVRSRLLSRDRVRDAARRDIKPDNVLLDAAGHAHLTDFNVAIHYSERRQHTSVAGSMAYMAPQVVGRKGYSWQIDWWSLGVTAYELLFHRRPFDGRTAERMTQSIIKDSLKFPEDCRTKCSDAGLTALKGVRTPIVLCSFRS